MRKLILFVLIAFFDLGIKAQMWCPPGAEWHFGAYSFYPSANGYFKYIYKNDTTISSTVYKKINSYFFGYNQMTGPFFQITYLGSYFSHENNNVVFFNNDTLYNFNANIGDKWLRMQIKNNFITNTSCDAPRRPVEVIDTGHVIINSTYLKRLTLKYQLKYVETNSLVPLTTYTDVVYQRIGSIGMAFSPERCEFMNPGTVLHPVSSIGFRCYSDNTFALYTNPQYTGSCAYVATTNLNEFEIENEALTIFPNPANDMLNVVSTGLVGDYKLQIYNLRGQMIREEEIIFKGGKAAIHTKELVNGVYVLTLFTSTSLSTSFSTQSDKVQIGSKRFVVAKF